MKINILHPTVKKIALITFCLLVQTSINGQELYKSKNLDTVFTNYIKPFQEVIYTHINKSTYIKGETLGFTSYAFNKKLKQLSNNTSNLYCLITDDKNKVVKQSLIKVENGIANGTFNIDTNFKSGTYTFKAYTNWMLNFSEQNYFVDTFKVIDPETTKFEKKTKRSHKIDVQFLPESGHLLSNTINTVGVIVKDSLGYGIPNLKGDIFDSKGKYVTNFNLNKLGIGRFSFTPNNASKYKAIIKNYGKDIIVNLNKNSHLQGVLLKISENNDNNALVSIVTNKNTLPNIKNKTFKLTFHNGNTLNKFDIKFSDKLNITKIIPLKKLTKGVNIFTLFDENNKPVAERIFFNYNGLKVLKSSISSNRIFNDTIINTVINFKNAKRSGFNNVSVSVLPKKTKSYFKNTNIISQTLLKPYIKGNIENGGYYFTNINKQKKYELDNLLITQGWSSYNWSEIFNNNNNFTHSFDQGISLKASNFNSKDVNSFVIHNLSNRSSEQIKVNLNNNSFTSQKYYPINNEQLLISQIGKNDKLSPVSLYIQFYPNNIPNFNKDFNLLSPFNNYSAAEYSVNTGNFYKTNQKNTLDEIELKFNLEKKRIEKITNKSHGRVFFSSNKYKHLTIAQFINRNNNTFIANVNHSTGDVSVVDTRQAGIIGLNARRDPPVILLDNFQLIDFRVLNNLRLDIVDYIEINEQGMRGRMGTRSGFGFIKIVTDPNKFYNSGIGKTTSKFKFPLTFTNAKEFYIPKYNNYNNSFFKEYGVIDWLPKNKIDRDGKLSINFTNKQLSDITLFIEGVTEDGDFIFETKTIKVPSNKEI